MWEKKEKKDTGKKRGRKKTKELNGSWERVGMKNNITEREGKNSFPEKEWKRWEEMFVIRREKREDKKEKEKM